VIRQPDGRFSRALDVRTLLLTSQPKEQQMKSKRNHKRRGQGMTEYILIVSLIAIASIGVATAFGNNLRVLFGMAADALAGDDNIAARGQHVTDDQQKKTLKTAFEKNGANY
jgi:Flp pilus assembly pilin Flp